MNKLKQITKNRITQLVVLFLIFIVTVMTVYAVVPTISLNSPTSFPVDI